MYKTKANDMFDFIAFKEYGDCNYTQELMRANRDKLKEFEFRAGEEINIPVIEKTENINLPPWRR